MGFSTTHPILSMWILIYWHTSSSGPPVRPFQILLGNFLATFRILSNFFVRKQLLATFRKNSTFLVTFGLFWTKMLNSSLFSNKQVKIILIKILNIFLVKLIFLLPFEWVSCGRSLNLVPRAFPFSCGALPTRREKPQERGWGRLWTVCKQNGGRHVVFQIVTLTV